MNSRSGGAFQELALWPASESASLSPGTSGTRKPSVAARRAGECSVVGAAETGQRHW
jgi:hypothetical protein